MMDREDWLFSIVMSFAMFVCFFGAFMAFYDIERDRKLTILTDGGDIRATYLIESSFRNQEGWLQFTTKDGVHLTTPGPYKLEEIQ